MKKHIFRVWDNDHNKYFEPTYEAWKGKLEDLHIGLLGDLFMRTMDGTIHCDSVMPGRFEIEMASHQLDGKGVVIHKGDIVEDDCGTKYLIVFKDSCFYGQYDENDSEGDIDISNKFAPLEVIGNIHQNPELI